MIIVVNNIAYEVTPTPGGLTFQLPDGDRQAFIPWARVMEHAFPMEPGEHTDHILDGSLTVPEYLAGMEPHGKPTVVR